MENEEYVQDAEVLQQVIAAFSRLDQESRKRIFQATATFFGIQLGKVELSSTFDSSLPSPTASRLNSSFSEDRSMSPKDFLAEKQPITDIERVACLGYYLTHYRDTPHFKTLDISKLNTEAAQVKLSNPAWSVENASKKGLLAPGIKGHKQMTAAGERYVLSLPDRIAAKESLAAVKSRRRKSKVKNPKIES